MNNYLAIKMFCLIKEIESVSSKEDKNKYLKTEDKVDKEIFNVFNNTMNEIMNPWIDDLTNDNEIDEIKDNILTDEYKIHSYLSSFENYADAYLKIVFDELNFLEPRLDECFLSSLSKGFFEGFQLVVQRSQNWKSDCEDD